MAPDLYCPRSQIPHIDVKPSQNPHADALTHDQTLFDPRVPRDPWLTRNENQAEAEDRSRRQQLPCQNASIFCPK
ncbi:hypothetical protein RRG08_019774 [Elysia crispata]|uniref:Uncharacterized protein n=1 Tax=Elysia crispata TaxID=231223 RepID=A0AAE1AVZ6_9GAST|nr:hypothetical protein RRG08_019774 [Elysia crispata]